MIPGLEDTNFQMLVRMRRPFLYALGTGLLAVVIVITAIIPQINQTYELYSEWQSEKPKLEKLRAKLADIDAVTVSPEFAQVQLVDQTLPSKKPLLEVLTSLNSVTLQSGARVSDFEISPGIVATDAASLEEAQKLRSSTQGPYDALTLELEIEGGFNQLEQFMYLVERVAPFTTISELELNTNSAQISELDESFDTFTATLQTDTYYFTQPISVTVEQALPRISSEDQLVLSELASFTNNDVPAQLEIIGGGLEDLFGVEGLEFE